MSCILRVMGVDLEPATVLAGSPLSIYRSWRKGEPRRPTGPMSQQLNEHGGFCTVASEADGDRVPVQIRDAIAYLTTNASHLEPLLSHHSVEERYLDFAWWFPVGESSSGAQFNRFPEELLALCSKLRLGVEVSVYSTSTKRAAE